MAEARLAVLDRHRRETCPASDLVDLDAGRIATGEATVEETGWDLFRLILDVASGRKRPRSDRWDLFNDLTLFNPAPIA